MTAISTLIADPEMEGTYFGIPVAYYGEDSRMIALGHHPERKALAAFNRHARTFIRFPNVADDRSAEAAYWENAIEHLWATFTAPDPADPTEYPKGFWYVQFADAGQPGALPVTVLDP